MKTILVHLAQTVCVLVLLVVPAACATKQAAKIPSGLQKINHFVFIMQENRSFDSYFGTYPGADGIPPGVALTDPWDGSAVRPYHDANDVNFDGPHGWENAHADMNGGKMDGFLKEAYKQYSEGAAISRAPGEDPREASQPHYRAQ